MFFMLFLLNIISLFTSIIIAIDSKYIILEQKNNIKKLFGIVLQIKINNTVK